MKEPILLLVAAACFSLAAVLMSVRRVVILLGSLVCLLLAAWLSLVPFTVSPSKEHRAAWYLMAIGHCPQDDGDAWAGEFERGVRARRNCIRAATARGVAGILLIGLAGLCPFVGLSYLPRRRAAARYAAGR